MRTLGQQFEEFTGVSIFDIVEGLMRPNAAWNGLSRLPLA
jgi:hypothetical protein